MCRQHLLGEHVELHMMVGSIEKGKSIQGHIDRKQIQTNIIQTRHDEIVKEMFKRGYNHKSLMNYKDELNLGIIYRNEMLSELWKRYTGCRMRMIQRNTYKIIENYTHNEVVRKPASKTHRIKSDTS